MKKIVSFSLMGMLLSLAFLSSCGGGKKKYVKSPVDKLITKYSNDSTFTIILRDMDVDESGWDPVYKHKYDVIRVVNDKPQKDSTGWEKVSEDFFWEHEKNLGMALATKTEDGKITKVASPPGYNNYVGNKRYGYWDNSGSWHFFANYMMFSTMMNLATRPIYRYDYDTYRRSYYGKRPYYGSYQSKPIYGTRSSYTKASRPNFFTRRSSKTGWSSSSRSTGYSGRTSSKGTGRYNSSRSYRSSGGGYGK